MSKRIAKNIGSWYRKGYISLAIGNNCDKHLYPPIRQALKEHCIHYRNSSTKEGIAIYVLKEDLQKAGDAIKGLPRNWYEEMEAKSNDTENDHT